MTRPATAGDPDAQRLEHVEVWIGGLSRAQLLAELSSRAVQLNAHAETLLESEAFEHRPARRVVLTERTVAEPGFADGASLSGILSAAQEQGFLLCPTDAGPYLRLTLQAQAASRDSAMSSGRAPDGALTVASAPTSHDDEYPKGFYLRVVDGRAWLRGYRCDDEHRWAPEDRFAFQDAPS